MKKKIVPQCLKRKPLNPLLTTTHFLKKLYFNIQFFFLKFQFLYKITKISFSISSMAQIKNTNLIIFKINIYVYLFYIFI